MGVGRQPVFAPHFYTETNQPTNSENVDDEIRKARNAVRKGN